MQRTFRLNNTAATFPLVSTFFGRSTMTRAPEDSNYIITNAYSGAQADRDIGIPMPIYMHNIMPTTQGLASVGYLDQNSHDAAIFDRAVVLRTNDNSRYIYSPGAGKVYDKHTKKWLVIGAGKSGVTVAYLHKRTYIAVRGEAVSLYNEATGQLQAVPLKGFDTRFLEGVTTANNYLVAYTKDTIYWSTPLDSLDFTPSLSTTASSEIPLALRGQITCCVPTLEGFTICTTTNMVSAKYSGNVRFPFQFSEIAGSGGVVSTEHVTHESNSDTQYAWTTQGLQVVGSKEAKHIFPEVTDFLSGHLLEDYIGPTGMIGHSNVSGQWASESQSWGDWNLGENNLRQFYWEGAIKVKLTLVDNRWLVVSYGTSELRWALVHDLALKRWGKLRVSHVDCFEFSTASGQNPQQEINHRLAFLQKDGNILVASFENRTIADDSVLIFGRLQHTRGKVLTIHAFEVENGRPGKMNLSMLTSLDGKNWVPETVGFAQIQTENLTKWLLRTTGINHCFKLTGSFDIVSLQGACTIGGGR
jgi:hypothetical protein